MRTGSLLGAVPGDKAEAMRYMLLIRKAPPRCCQVSTLANTAIVENQEHHQHHRNGEEQAVADEMSRCLGEPIERIARWRVGPRQSARSCPRNPRQRPGETQRTTPRGGPSHKNAVLNGRGIDSGAGRLPPPLARRCPGWIPPDGRVPPAGPLGLFRGDPDGALQRPGLAALHLRRPVKHGIQVRTTSFLRSPY